MAELDRSSSIQAVVIEVHLPAGMAGPEPLDFDVRCFLVAHPEGVVLVDTGMEGSHGTIEAGLRRIGAAWDDITDIVLTHGHEDHVGGLREVTERSRRARVWAGAGDHAAIQSDRTVQTLVAGETVES